LTAELSERCAEGGVDLRSVEVHDTSIDATSIPARAEPLPGASARIQLRLLGAFGLSDQGESVALSRGTQRLLAFVALQGHPAPREVIAEALWPEVPPDQSLASLRSAIWRLEPSAREALSIDTDALAIAAEVDLDLVHAKALARRILREGEAPREEDATPEAIAVLSSDIAHERQDHWATFEGEYWRQLRLHALEALAEHFLETGRYSDALETAFEAKKADPLRESPRALFIRTYLAEGNQSDAVREFLAFRELLQKELGISPTLQLRGLLRGLS